MKKGWFIILAVVVLSLAVLLVASRFGFYNDASGFHIVNKDAAQIFADKDARKFENIEIKADSTNIEFVTADDYGFEYMTNSAVDTVYSNENGILTITQTSRGKLFSLNRGDRNDYIKIYIPEEAMLKNVAVTDFSGNITIDRLTADKLEISATSGNADIKNIQAAAVLIDKTSGNVTMDSCKADNLNVNLTSGHFKANSMDMGGMTVQLTSGNAELNGELRGINDITSISGNVTLNIQGEKKDYNSNISVVSGNVNVDGSSTKTYEYENADAANSLKINATSGNVTVNFKGQ